jgi:hypothetical protein
MVDATTAAVHAAEMENKRRLIEEKLTRSVDWARMMGSPFQMPGGATAAMPKKPTPTELVGMIAMRMRWKNGEAYPFHHLTAVQREDEVFVIVIGETAEPVILKDSASLFPCDALITSLRLLEEKR